MEEIGGMERLTVSRCRRWRNLAPWGGEMGPNSGSGASKKTGGSGGNGEIQNDFGEKIFTYPVQEAESHSFSGLQFTL